MSTPTLQSYDEVPYIDHSIPQSHPDRLATIARLLGMAPKDVRRCRVLEVGCARGTNVIPMAFGLPESKFVGLDLSARQIEEARAMADAVGATNVELRHAGIDAVDASWGRFDYIIAHGIYSWVPGPVRDALLALCARNLAPQGVAFVSFNTHPGWRIRGIVRDMMRFHTAAIANPAERIREARRILDFMAQHTPQNDPYGAYLRLEAGVLRGQADNYLYHEHLEDENHAVYFHEFMRLASAAGLQYLGDARFADSAMSGFPPEVAQGLREMAHDLVSLEQYKDFLQNRAFRDTLLVHADVKVQRQVDARALEGLEVRGQVRPRSPRPSLAAGAAETYEHPNGASVTTADAFAKATLTEIGARFPHSIAFEELVAAAHARLSEADAAAAKAQDEATRRRILAENVMRGFVASLLELRAVPVRFPATPSDRPRATRLARVQAAGAGPVVNALHEWAMPDAFKRELIPMLDGTRTRAELVAALAQSVREGRLAARRPDGSARPPAEVERMLREALDESLRSLAKSGFLDA